jgi:hypothetical protein
MTLHYVQQHLLLLVLLNTLASILLDETVLLRVFVDGGDDGLDVADALESRVVDGALVRVRVVGDRLL